MEIVSFEISKKLKEKGYTQDITKHNAWYATEYYKNSCLGEYFEGELTPIGECGDKINALHIIEAENKGVVAPTISQVLKWLREDKKIIIVNRPEGFNKETKRCLFFYEIYDENPGYFWEHIEYPQSFHTWEESSVAAIEYVLDNLI